MKPNSSSTEIKKLLEDTQVLMDDSTGPLSPIVRRAVRLAGLVGDAEHRDLFQLHLEGFLYAESAGPRHTPWTDPEGKPRWDVRKAFSDDRESTNGNIAAFPLEELEQHYRRFRDERLRFRNSGDVKNELKLFEIEVDAEKTIFRIRRRVDTFLQLVINWVDVQESSQAESHQIRPMGGAVFIGHGRSPAWRDLKDFLGDRLGLSCVEFNSESAAGKTTVERLEEMLDTSYFAFLVMSGRRARRFNLARA
jgi:hypothetical protein